MLQGVPEESREALFKCALQFDEQGECSFTAKSTVSVSDRRGEVRWVHCHCYIEAQYTVP